ncbi:hypothetical protein MNBD_GAMMA23-1170 [hydrothermal vent metagenome]|uniref:histidine kinase n=1 Tax=hydrothermal vent metagenome TaxID=652676 RepID=A0A3B1A959_9ZZZZ
MKMSILAGSVTALASLIVGSLIINGSSDIIFQNALNRLQYETNIKSLKLISDIKNLSGDAQYLVGTPPIKGIPRAINNSGIDPLDKSSTKTWKLRLATIFSELIRAKENYLQIRYIGIANGGKELIRVDRKGRLIQTIPKNQLQKKGNTGYFKNATKINPGEVYLSDITLNREFGKISEPHTPVIRAAAPVYYNNKLFGILVINMEFNQIFNELIKSTPRELIPYVTNEKGYFLAHPNKAMTYGFDHGNNNRIQSVYPSFNLERTNDLRDIEYTVNSNDDVIHVVKTHYDPLREDRYFAVMQATSRKNLESRSDALEYKSYTIMGILVIVSLIVSAILASRLMKPLSLITAASEDIAHGREVSDLPITSRDEIGELAQSFDTMRHQLKEKERELIVSQGHVHHANKMASLGEMASGMAHEINSPIQTINLIAQRIQRQLKKGISNEDINASMDKITTSVKKVSALIDSLRKVSRDSTSDDFSETRICDLISDAVNMTEERFKVNNIQFDVNFHNISENMTIQCQRLQISQVIINLVNNSNDAISELDDKWIKINIDKIDGKVRFTITDSGSGIPDNIAAKIFEPMFTTKDIGKGTGLSLSISCEIILKHNGRLYINKESPNTCFIIELPVTHIA